MNNRLKLSVNNIEASMEIPDMFSYAIESPREKEESEEDYFGNQNPRQRVAENKTMLRMFIEAYPDITGGQEDGAYKINYYQRNIYAFLRWLRLGHKKAHHILQFSEEIDVVFHRDKKEYRSWDTLTRRAYWQWYHKQRKLMEIDDIEYYNKELEVFVNRDKAD